MKYGIYFGNTRGADYHKYIDKVADLDLTFWKIGYLSGMITKEKLLS